MRRRELLGVLGATAAWSLCASAQQSATPIIGYLSGRSAQTDVPMIAAFRQGLFENDYVDRQNVAIEYRFADGDYDRLSALADDLVRHGVSVLVTGGGEVSALAAKAATGTIPIVFNVGNDPVRFGLVASLNRPGGNLTGVTSFLGALGPKQLGLLRELVPTATVIALLVNPNEAFSEVITRDLEEAAHIAGQQLIVVRAGTEADLEAAFVVLIQQRAGAVLVGAGPFFVTQRERLVALAARHAVPAMYFRREFAEVGGLISYSSAISEGYRQMGGYTSRILKGEKASDLPILQPTKFELVINLKTAKALGIVVPNSMQLLADEVIE